MLATPPAFSNSIVDEACAIATPNRIHQIARAAEDGFDLALICHRDQAGDVEFSHVGGEAPEIFGLAGDEQDLVVADPIEIPHLGVADREAADQFHVRIEEEQLPGSLMRQQNCDIRSAGRDRGIFDVRKRAESRQRDLFLRGYTRCGKCERKRGECRREMRKYFHTTP